MTWSTATGPAASPPPSSPSSRPQAKVSPQAILCQRLRPYVTRLRPPLSMVQDGRVWPSLTLLGTVRAVGGIHRKTEREAVSVLLMVSRGGAATGLQLCRLLPVHRGVGGIHKNTEREAVGVVLMVSRGGAATDPQLYRVHTQSWVGERLQREVLVLETMTRCRTSPHAVGLQDRAFPVHPPRQPPLISKLQILRCKSRLTVQPQVR